MLIFLAGLQGVPRGAVRCRPGGRGQLVAKDLERDAAADLAHDLFQPDAGHDRQLAGLWHGLCGHRRAARPMPPTSTPCTCTRRPSRAIDMGYGSALAWILFLLSCRAHLCPDQAVGPLGLLRRRAPRKEDQVILQPMQSASANPFEQASSREGRARRSGPSP